MIIQINISKGFYLQVKKPDNSFLYTCGRLFTMSKDLYIVSQEGYRLIGPIKLPAISEPYYIKVNKKGELFVLLNGNWVETGQIMAISFFNAEGLKNIGDEYYEETNNSGRPNIGRPGEGSFANAKTYSFLQGFGRKRPRAVLNIINLRKIGDFIIKMRAIYANMSQHPDLYPSPLPTLEDFLTNIDALEVAEGEVSTRKRGKVSERDLAYDKVLINVHNLFNYVQILADRADSFEESIRLIISSGFDLKKRLFTAKSELKAINIIPSGTVKLIAKAVEGAGAYKWQKSSDCINWVEFNITLKATTIIEGLTPGTRVYFRCRAVLRKGYAEWSQAVSLIIV